MDPRERQTQVGCLPVRRRANQRQPLQEQPQRRPDSTGEVQSAASSGYRPAISSVQLIRPSLAAEPPTNPLSDASSMISLLQRISSGSPFSLGDSAEDALAPTFRPQQIQILPLGLLQGFARYLDCINCGAIDRVYGADAIEVDAAYREFAAARDFQNSIQAILSSPQRLVSMVTWEEKR